MKRKQKFQFLPYETFSTDSDEEFLDEGPPSICRLAIFQPYLAGRPSSERNTIHA